MTAETAGAMAASPMGAGSDGATETGAGGSASTSLDDGSAGGGGGSSSEAIDGDLAISGSGGQAGSASASNAGAEGMAVTEEDGSEDTAAPAPRLSLTPGSGIWTSVRGLAEPPVLSFQIHNPGDANVVVETIDIRDSDLFEITEAPDLPASIAAGASIGVSVQIVTAVDALPPAPAQDSGGTSAAGSLAVTAGDQLALARLHGLVLTQANWEPTFGQVLAALDYDVDVGVSLRTDANPNVLPGVDEGTDEIDAPLFVRAGPGDVSLTPVARFSPEGVMPFGFYEAGDANARTEVGSMDAEADTHTSNKARIVLPPVVGATSFDPGTAPFGVWAFTNQVAEGNAQHGNYLYTEDALNVSAAPHRVKVYPLADGSGTIVDNSYLLACEEAGNGDYQDYVFVLANVVPAP